MNFYLLITTETFDGISRQRLIPILPEEVKDFNDDRQDFLNGLVVRKRSQAPEKTASSFKGTPPKLVLVKGTEARSIDGAHYLLKDVYRGALILQRRDGYQPYSIVSD